MHAVRNAWLLVGYAVLNFGLLMLLPLFASSGLPGRYSPLLLPLITLLFAAGPWAFAVVHLGAVATLVRLSPWIAGLVAFSAFLFMDMLAESFFTFVAVAAAFAIAGSRIGALAYLALTLLVPTPVAIPLAVWLVWRRPDIRQPFAALFAINVIGLAVSGHALGWIGALVQATTPIGGVFAIGPGQVFGLWWLAIGVPVAAWMVLRGSARTAALAGLVAAPYLMPQYLLLAVVAFAAHRVTEYAGSGVAAPQSTGWYAGARGVLQPALVRIRAVRRP